MFEWLCDILGNMSCTERGTGTCAALVKVPRVWRWMCTTHTYLRVLACMHARMNTHTHTRNTRIRTGRTRVMMRLVWLFRSLVLYVMYARKYLYMCACVCVRVLLYVMYACTYLCVCACACLVFRVRTHTQALAPAPAPAHTYTYTSDFGSRRVCMYVHTLTHSLARSFTHTHVCRARLVWFWQQASACSVFMPTSRFVMRVCGVWLYTCDYVSYMYVLYMASIYVWCMCGAWRVCIHCVCTHVCMCLYIWRVHMYVWCVTCVHTLCVCMQISRDRETCVCCVMCVYTICMSVCSCRPLRMCIMSTTLYFAYVHPGLCGVCVVCDVCACIVYVCMSIFVCIYNVSAYMYVCPLYM